ncbi:hypothetical protein AMTRI_Chr02g220250 [Amborella trichopoda]
MMNIEEAVFSLMRDKALRLDGFLMAFFQEFRDVIKGVEEDKECSSSQILRRHMTGLSGTILKMMELGGFGARVLIPRGLHSWPIAESWWRDGAHAAFWSSKWIGNCTLKIHNIKDVVTGQVNQVLWNLILDVRSVKYATEQQFASLTHILYYLIRGERVVWELEARGSFTMKSLYHCLIEDKLFPVTLGLVKFRHARHHKGLRPSLDKVLTIEQLWNRGVVITKACIRDAKTGSHLFLRSPVVASIWEWILWKT